MTGRASRRALGAIAASLAIAVAILFVATVFDALPGPGSPTSVTAPTQGHDTPRAGTGGTGDEPETDSGDNGPEAGTLPDDGGSSSDRTSSEVLPAPDETSIGLPPSAPLPALVTTPLPPTANATGALVAGFPMVIPLAPDSSVLTSSVASAENRLQAAVAATTPLAPAAVLEFYRIAFAASALVDSVAPAAAGSTALLFSRGGPDTLLVTVSPGEAGTSYSIFGAFTAT